MGSVHVLDPHRGDAARSASRTSSRASRCTRTSTRSRACRGSSSSTRRMRRSSRRSRSRAPNGNVIRRYIMPVNAHLMVQDGETVHAGDVLAKIPRETTKTKDITGGLPRVVELFEARKPKDPAVISEIDGTVKYGGVVKGQRRILIVADDPQRRAAGILDSARRARQRAGRRARARGRSADGRPEQPARHSARAGREGAAEVPGERDPGGLPAPGREHQRQAHRGHHAADDALGADRGCGRHRVPDRRAGGQVPLPRRERARDHARRPAGVGAAAAARDHEGVALDRVVHLGGLLPGDDEGAHRGGDLRQDRLPARSEGERHDGPADSGGHGLLVVSARADSGGRTATAAAGACSRATRTWSSIARWSTWRSRKRRSIAGGTRGSNARSSARACSSAASGQRHGEDIFSVPFVPLRLAAAGQSPDPAQMGHDRRALVIACVGAVLLLLQCLPASNG